MMASTSTTRKIYILKKERKKNVTEEEEEGEREEIHYSDGESEVEIAEQKVIQPKKRPRQDRPPPIYWIYPPLRMDAIVTTRMTLHV